MALRDFIQACETQDEAAMQAALVDLDVHQVDADGQTALLWAAKSGHCASVHALIARGSKVNQTDHDGWTPLMGAAVYGRESVVSPLLAAGAEISLPNRHGRTPLICAALNDHASVAQQLLAAGAEVNHTDAHGHTPLLCAAGNGHLNVVSSLLAAGAEVRLANSKGHSPLILAVLNGHENVVRFLIGQSDLHQVDQRGRNALNCAMDNLEWSCADLLATHDPQFEHLEWPRQATPADLPQWHARLEQKALQNALQEQHSASQGDWGQNRVSSLAQKNARKQRL